MDRPGVPWAKLTRDAAGAVTAVLSLVDHCLDVGAVADALLGADPWTRALEAAAGRPLTPRDLARLAVLAALHDLGKANRGFQDRWRAGAEPVGHTGPVAALLGHTKLRGTSAACLLNDMIAAWGARQHMAAAMAHHGPPLAEFDDDPPPGPKPWAKHTGHWKPAGGHDPAADVLPLIAAVRARWPEAWEEGEPLPGEPRFVALFAGLVTMADWIGSNEAHFPVGALHGVARAALRDGWAADAVRGYGLAALPTPAGDFAAATGFDPNGFQEAAAADDLGLVALIEAETGSGKTEAALWRWLELRRRGVVDGLFFALPTRSAAAQMQGRVEAVLRRVWGADAPTVLLAVPGYLRPEEDHDLPGAEIGAEAGAPPDTLWAAERSNRFTAARVAVGTVDQALLAALPVRHALFRAAALARSLLVVDEVHASDAYMGALLEGLLNNHVGVGGHALLLSATLGAAARARFLGGPVPPPDEAAALPYPALSGRGVLRPAAGSGADKRVGVEVAGLIADPRAVAERAVAAARAGAAMLVVRNTVADAVATARAVEELAPEVAFRVADTATLHHGRFAPADRRTLDGAVERAFGRGRRAGGVVLVGTQTLEQSLDIDADWLVTDLAPMDVLLQRIGRLHRHARDDRGAFADARVLVLRPAERDLSAGAALRHGLGPNADGRGVYPDLLQLEGTLRLLEQGPEIVLPRDNRRLVEGALHPEAVRRLAARLGPDWENRRARRATGEYGDRGTAERVRLDLSVPFRCLSFAHGEAAATRLGARDLLVDLGDPLDGPFGDPVDRIAIPDWMARGVTRDHRAERLEAAHFRLGPHTYAYDRWGLRADG